MKLFDIENEAAINSYMDSLRQQFPQLRVKVNEHTLCYLDSAATTLKPKILIDSISKYYEQQVSNVHRSSHSLSNKATQAYEEARKKAAKYFNVQDSKLIWTSGTTESINLLAFAFICNELQAGDEIIVSALEHHANLVVWQELAKAQQATLKIIPFSDTQGISFKQIKQLCSTRTKLLAITGLSNVLGYAPQLQQIMAYAKQQGIYSLVDGAQLAMHGPLDLTDLNCDFFACSAHKMYGPDGVGLLYGRGDLLKRFKPLRFGGEMISQVTYQQAHFAALPSLLEAGTPNIAGIIAFGHCIDYLQSLNWSWIQQYERQLLDYLYSELEQIPEVTFYSKEHTGLLSFALRGLHHHDIANYLDLKGIAIRSGHHCAMPLVKDLHDSGLLRVSVALYTSKNDINYFISELKQGISELQATESKITKQEVIKAKTTSTQKRKIQSTEFNALIKSFQQLKSWEGKYRQLLLLGKTKPDDKNKIRKPENEIQGCESQAWLTYEIQNMENEKPHYVFHIDSDAKIIRGLASILLMAVNNKTAEEIRNFKHHKLLTKLGLDIHISGSRANGLNAIAQKIQSIVAQKNL